MLPQCPALQVLILYDNEICAEGAGILAGVLSQCPSLSLLNLSCNEVGTEGAGEKRFEQAVQFFPDAVE